ncbi:MAG: type II secretion system inner membrane protein GspF [Oligoflexales bacterium]|nr:type II secretion system inner membrane protein GspF [Oligoflexales bacterium]
MPQFSYKGMDAVTGQARKGIVEAESKKAAKIKLRQKDKVIAYELKEEVASENQKKKASFLGSGVGMSELAVMTRQFATLQSAHVPLDESLKALSAQVENITLRNTLSDIKDQVSEGKSLAEAVSKFPKIFNRLYINMIRAGEQSGTLGLVLKRLADFIEYQVAVRGQVTSAIAYPSAMIFSSMAIVVYLFVSVVPKLQKVFASLKVSLPWYTELLITFSEGLQKHWPILIVLIAAVVYFVRRWVQTEEGRRKFDKWTLELPLFGQIILRVNTSKFTRTLSTLLSSGVPIINSLEITKNIIGNSLLADVLEEAKIGVQEGKNLGDCISKSELFPPLVTHMIKTGEKTGQLEEMLNHVAEAYDAEVQRKIAAMISLIEPFMIIFMGGIVTVVIIALLVPMLGVMSQMR